MPGGKPSRRDWTQAPPPCTAYPNRIAHIAEALWMQALEEGKRRATLEQRDSARLAELDKQRLELRSHVLTLREGELDSRLRDRDRTIEELNLRLRELTGLLHTEQATRESQAQRITTLQTQLLARVSTPKRTARTRTPTQAKRKKTQLKSGRDIQASRLSALITALVLLLAFSMIRFISRLRCPTADIFAAVA